MILSLLLAPLFFQAAPLAGLVPEPPRCAEATHDRLRVQKGRDVCAASLSPKGLELAPGLMPTRCLRAGWILQIDADGLRDLCMRKPT